jgi:cysteine desulfurase family protein
MIYLDNAATSWPKAPGVGPAMADFIQNSAGNPGRGVHRLALAAARTVETTRSRLAARFGIADPARLVFTTSTTAGINLALKGLIGENDHVLTTTMEHNAVTRPLHALAKQRGARVEKVSARPDGHVEAEDLITRIRPDTRLVVMAHASNVCGALQPVAEIGAACRRLGVPLLVDAAQTAGLFPIDVAAMGISMLAFPGHKSLLGPTGTGGLYVAPGIDLAPAMEGGTGTQSESPEQPSGWPERHEAGTVNTVGLAGLLAALDFLDERGTDALRAHELHLASRLRHGLAALPGVRLLGAAPEAAETDAPVLAFVIDGLDGGDIAVLLDRDYEIAARPGLHCAPDAHRTLGSLASGAVRLSPGPFNTDEDIDQTLAAVAAIARGAGK